MVLNFALNIAGIIPHTPPAITAITAISSSKIGLGISLKWSAAKLAANEPNSAAICAHVAAKLYNLPILFENIEDKDNNKTRFFILSDFENSPSGNDKTSILVNLPDEQGVLVRFLSDFNNAGINLTKIKSHIVEGNSIFFIDFDGHKDDENIKKVLEKHKSSIKVLGSYVKEIKDI